MAWRGPSGLLGAPAAEEAGNFEAYPVAGQPGVTAFIHREVLEHLRKARPTREGDPLFYVEGIGRIRFRLLPAGEPDPAASPGTGGGICE